MKNICIIFGVLVTLLSEVGYSQYNLDSTTKTKEIDTSILHGVLDNGLTYYIKPLNNVSGEVKMNFIVKTGNFKEKPHQNNFAHHIEHLAFRETTNFPEGLKSNEKLLVSLGMNARDVSGKTGGKATVYNFEIPRPSTRSILVGLKWFRDIATELNLSKNNINRERGVLLQEYLAMSASREELATEEILNGKLFPCMHKDNQNFIVHNKTFPYKDLQKFHRKWYRPDLMAISIVGNIENPKELESLIKKNFSAIKRRTKVLKEENCTELYFNSDHKFSIVKREVNSIKKSFGKPINLNLYFRDQTTLEKRNSLSGYKSLLEAHFITKILNTRFREEAKVYNHNARRFSIHTMETKTSNSGKPESALKVIIRTRMHEEVAALEKTISIIQQLKKYGISKRELEKTREQFLKDFSLTQTRNTDYWLAEIKKHFVYHDILPKNKNACTRDIIANFSKEEIDKSIQRLFSNEPEDIGIILPLDYSSLIENEKHVRRKIRSVFKSPANQYQIPQAPAKLLTEKEIQELEPRKIASTFEKSSNIQEYVLENGLKIVLNPLKSNSSSGKISLHGFTPFGAACFPKNDYFSAIYAPSIVKNTGIGQFSKFDLERYFQKFNSIQTGIYPYISFKEAGIKGEVTKEEFEDFLQIIFLYFSQPQINELAFKDWKHQSLSNSYNSLNPVNDLIDAINRLTKDSTQPPYSSDRIKGIKKVNLNRAFEIYRALFSSAENFTFIVTGHFDKKDILPLLQKYLGNLPNHKKLECSNQRHSETLTQGPVFKKGNISDLYTNINSYFGLEFVKPRAKKDTWKEEVKVKVLGMILNDLLFKFRSDEGLSLYHYGAGGNYNRPLGRYEIMFRFNCVPEELPKIRNLTKELISNIKLGKIDQNIFSNAINKLLAQYSRINQEKLSNKLDNLYKHYRYGERINGSKDWEEYLNSLKREDITNTAIKYLKEDHSYELILHPEELAE